MRTTASPPKIYMRPSPRKQSYTPLWSKRMPPHDRLCGRLTSLVSRVTQSPRHDEPLLFLYPRWFTAGASKARFTTTTGTRESVQKEPIAVATSCYNPNTTGVETKSSGIHATQRSPAKARQAEASIRHVDTRPSKKLVNRIISKDEAKKRIGLKRRERQSKYTDSEDWYRPFERLRKHTPSGAQAHVRQSEQVNMPDGMVGYYSGDLNTFFLETYLCTSCRVQVSREEVVAGGSETFRALVLAGTPPAIRAAKLRLNDAIRIRSASQPGTDDDKEDAKTRMGHYKVTSEPALRVDIRASWSRDASKRSGTKPISAIPLPQTWDIITFANYVEDLTSSKPPRILRRAVDSSKLDDSKSNVLHVDFIDKTLERLFTTSSLHPFISSHATSIAFDFLSHHRRMPTIRRIIESLDASTYRGPLDPSMPSSAPPPSHPALDIRAFNACITAAAHAQDLHNYNFLSSVIVTRNLQPDFTTWNSLLILVHARNPKAARSIILRNMREKGMLENPQAKMLVAASLIEDAFATWVDRGGSTTAFLEHWDHDFAGPEWLEPSVANRMIHVRARRGQFDDAFAIVAELRARGRAPTHVTLNTLVEEAAAQSNVPATLASLRCVLHHVDQEPNNHIRIEERLWTHLFWLARRTRSFNMLKVVWRYACLSGNVSPVMKQKVIRDVALYAPAPTLPSPSPTATPIPSSEIETATETKPEAALTTYKPTPTAHPDISLSAYGRLKLFRCFAYKAMLNISDGQPFEDVSSPPTTSSSSPSTTKSLLLLNSLLPPPPIQSPPTTTPAQEAAEKELHASRYDFFAALVQRDLNAFWEFRPVDDWVDVLEVAARRDGVWREGGRILGDGDGVGVGGGVSREEGFQWVLDNAVGVEVVAVKRDVEGCV